jgi:DNA-binding XRE family transcriptional regulator
MLLIVCSLIVYTAVAFDAVSNRERATFHPHRVAFGNRIRHLRESQGLSQEQLADLAGIHRTYMSGVERGQRNIGLDNIVAIARALGVPTACLFDDPPPDHSDK